MTGRLPRPQFWWYGRSPPQPPSFTHASHSSKVISNLLTAKGAAMVTRCRASACCSEGAEPIVNSPAGITTIRGQPAQSLNSVRAPGTLQMAGGAERRCCGERASRRARADATSAAVLALSSAIRASSLGWAGRASAWAGGTTAVVTQAMIPRMRARAVMLPVLANRSANSCIFTPSHDRYDMVRPSSRDSLAASAPMFRSIAFVGGCKQRQRGDPLTFSLPAARPDVDAFGARRCGYRAVCRLDPINRPEARAAPLAPAARRPDVRLDAS